MFRSRPLVVTLAGLVGLSLACARQVPVPEAYQPSYSYTPQASSAGQGISIALVSPRLGQAAVANVAAQYMKLMIPLPADFATRMEPSYRAFTDAISRSITQYFTASGMTVSGPFSSIDDMTFPDKKQADLVLTMEVNVTTDQPPFSINYSQIDGSVQKVWSRGVCSAGGTLDFVLWEPLSQQRMWAKSIDVPRAEVECTLEAGSQPAYFALLGNAFARLYEGAFANVMITATRYFAPEEVALVRQQSAELREKKVY